MHISEEYAVRLVKENQELRRQLRMAQGELQERLHRRMRISTFFSAVFS